MFIMIKVRTTNPVMHKTEKKEKKKRKHPLT
jgi:hypothetical protein